MTDTFKILSKSTSFIIILSFFVFGLYAQDKYEGYLTNNNKTCLRKTTPKTNCTSDIKLAQLEDQLIIEEKKLIEEWMLDSKSWEIKQSYEFQDEYIEKTSELEDWMLDSAFFKINCKNLRSSNTIENKITKYSYPIL